MASRLPVQMPANGPRGGVNWSMPPSNAVNQYWQYSNRNEPYYAQVRNIQRNTQTANDVDTERYNANSKFQEIRQKFGEPQVETLGMTPAWYLTDQKWIKIKQWSQNVADGKAEN